MRPRDIRTAIPPAFEADLLPLVEGERQTVLEILQEGRTAAKVCEVASNAHSFCDGMLTTAVPITVACQAGCAWCCHQYVEVTPPEAFALARWIEETSAPAEREAWVALFRQRAAQARGKSVRAYGIAK